MGAYKGAEPCHGCGRPGSEQPRWNGRNSLCSECRENVEKGKRVKDEKTGGPFASMFFGRHIGPGDRPSLIDVTEKNVRRDPVIFRGNQLPYLSDGFRDESGRHKEYNGSTASVLDAFEKLALTIDLGEKNNVTAHLNHRTHLGKESTVTLVTAKAWIELLDAVALYAQRLRKDSHAEGTNLLLQLNAGTLNVADFNRLAKHYDGE